MTVEDLLDSLTSSELAEWMIWMQLQAMSPEQRASAAAGSALHGRIHAFFARRKEA